MKPIHILCLAAICGGVAVGLGAFGAHALKALLSAYSLDIWNKGVSYQFYHTFALLAAALLGLQAPQIRQYVQAGYFFVGGIACFSGSLYALALRDVFGADVLPPMFGIITPIGGVLFMVGWALLLWGAIVQARQQAA